MRIIYSENSLWDYFIGTLSNQYYIEKVPIIKGNINRLIVHLLWKCHNIKILNKIIPYEVGMNDDTTLVLDIYKPNELYKISCSVSRDTSLLLWFWNPLKPTLKFHNIRKTINDIKSFGYKIYTFDPDDAIEYSLNLKPQFGIKSNISFPIENDLYFCGKPKGRSKIIESIVNLASEIGFKSKIIIPSSSSDYISYRDNLINLCKSRCIIDVTQSCQRGLTLRPIEAIINNKKLITNNIAIRDYDFYNPDNIFIWGIDSISNFKQFLQKPYSQVSNSIINKYIFSNWVMEW